ncbi:MULTISPECIES: ImmA/IrrE family metallo-endopeptidase [Xenorhabdus]|uniref:ImmA/IrrE family metallo-endopeptidase n=1 Tax=Xenorhabdus TaxID=626 RepID=UPI00064985BE|nr:MULTISPECIES: ImmA/IrrE family metallo-endopeptidase [Xenorhabdus]KLU14171.1 hypothetical protein AAY47_17920 [Xenorhabdus griffiniae]KOP32972.1 hypothetical protein AFK69_13105 [Xenorhabdus sp. GDc328]
MSGPVFKVPPLSRRAIRELADTVRNKFKVSGLYFPVMEMLEFVMPEIEKDFTLEVHEISEMGNNHGLAIPGEKKIILREDVYNQALEGSGRDRMTAAHELGHYFLHKDVAFARAYDVNVLKAYESSEWQANCFGGELLIPASHSKELLAMSIDDVANECGVSIEAAEKQVKEFRKLYEK